MADKKHVPDINRTPRPRMSQDGKVGDILQRSYVEGVGKKARLDVAFQRFTTFTAVLKRTLEISIEGIQQGWGGLSCCRKAIHIYTIYCTYLLLGYH